ncbi:glutaredoxin family protein [Cyanobium sp. ATX-6F1]|uniref:glutaredoxin family protein n=1 Tax=Cyanobium sp. ATX-6F1 TaxID=3137388 RepID=UPI0039BE3BC5
MHEAPYRLYTRSDCCLCQGLEERLSALDPAPELVLIDVDTDPELQARYGLEVPVLAVRQGAAGANCRGCRRGWRGWTAGMVAEEQRYAPARLKGPAPASGDWSGCRDPTTHEPLASSTAAVGRPGRARRAGQWGGGGPEL